jgi:Fe-S-cluster containining protein
MSFEMDPQKLKRLARRRERDDNRFRMRLKSSNLTSVKIDAIVRKSYKRISAQIDCKQCGNCCAAVKPVYLPKDVQRLADHLKITPEEFTSQYLEEDEEGDLCLKEIPCSFLKDKLCSVYESRPEVCRDYPYLDKPDFITRTMGTVENCSVCPIIFLVYEDIKCEIASLDHDDENEW